MTLTPSLQEDIAIYSLRLACVIVGCFPIYLGYRLFKLGFDAPQGNCKIVFFKQVTIQMSQFAPGLLFVTLGAAIASLGFWHTFSVEREYALVPQTQAASTTDTPDPADNPTGSPGATARKVDHTNRHLEHHKSNAPAKTKTVLNTANEQTQSKPGETSTSEISMPFLTKERKQNFLPDYPVGSYTMALLQPSMPCRDGDVDRYEEAAYPPRLVTAQYVDATSRSMIRLPANGVRRIDGTLSTVSDPIMQLLLDTQTNGGNCQTPSS